MPRFRTSHHLDPARAGGAPEPAVRLHSYTLLHPRSTTALSFLPMLRCCYATPFKLQSSVFPWRWEWARISLVSLLPGQRWPDATCHIDMRQYFSTGDRLQGSTSPCRSLCCVSHGAPAYLPHSRCGLVALQPRCHLPFYQKQLLTSRLNGSLPGQLTIRPLD